LGGRKPLKKIPGGGGEPPIFLPPEKGGSHKKGAPRKKVGAIWAPPGCFPKRGGKERGKPPGEKTFFFKKNPPVL